MKVVSILGIFVGCVGLGALGAAPARAQAEVDPDHFELSNVKPNEEAKTNATGEATALRYDGKVTLPYTVQCSGKNLPPGKYSVSLHSEGKIVQATLKQKDQVIAVLATAYKQARKYESDALLVERKGKTRRLSAIQVAELNLVFEPKLPKENSTDGKPGRVEKLLLTETGQTKR
jgi:hypothetical protein